MDYDLTRLGAQNFEEMCRAIFHKELGPTVQQFGDGPDGGREATYRGPVEALTGTDGLGWDGHVVLQAKFRRRLLGTPHDQEWLIGQVRRELREWADPHKKRRSQGRVPDYIVIASNVVLTPAVGAGGADSLEAVLEEFAPLAGIRGWLVWHHDTLCSILDDATEIRRTYRGMITTGDVLSKLLDDLEGAAANLGETLRLHTAQALVKDRFVRLAESGGTSRLTLEQVGVDLPIVRSASGTPAEPLKAIAELIRIGDHVLRHDQNPSEPSKIVLMGGPGQGKTTLTNLLAQTYRLAILMGEPDRYGPQVKPVLADTVKMMEDQGIPIPRNRRWPIRIDLAALAEESPDRPGGLLIRIANTVTAGNGDNLDRYGFRSWFRQYPWLLILDGYDEVASAAARRWIKDELTDLFVQADSMTSDLMTVITTRPQGYEDDFGSIAGTEHMKLRSLATSEALVFAERFATKHFGQDITERDKVLRRVRTASHDPETARLMVSPLQVTILTLLLEGRERAPHGRYRLFDAYFDTIYRREMNKPGEVGQLLEEHRRDIEYVHEQVGLDLHIAGESAEGSEAIIHNDRLRELAAERLRAQGHELGAADTLARSIVDKATTRLVLLVPKKDGIGFEVRSLQEYMTARAITQGPDAHILQRLSCSAPSAHWRNVWLLAIARVLDVKEHLRSGVLALLGEVGSDPIAHRVGLVAELANELLTDSVGATIPSFQQQLLGMLLTVLDLPPRPFDIAPTLHRLAEEKAIYRSSTVDALERAIHGRADTRAASWLVLSELRTKSGVLGATAQNLLERHVASEPELQAMRAWRDSIGRLGERPKMRTMTLASFMREDPAAYLHDPTDLSQLQSLTEVFTERKVNVLRDHPTIALPERRSMTTGGLADPALPTSLLLREALAIAVDSIDPASWAASSEIRSALWRSARRAPIGPQLRAIP